MLHAACWKCRTQKIAKNSPSGHHRNKARIDNRKKIVNQQYLRHMPHNMADFGLPTAHIRWRVWAPQQMATGFACWLRYCSDVTQRKPTKLCTMFGRLLRGYTIYTFLAAEFYQVQNSLCVLQVLRSPIGSLTARHSSSGREPNFAALSTGRHLYSTGPPSRWALAHILHRESKKDATLTMAITWSSLDRFAKHVSNVTFYHLSNR